MDVILQQLEKINWSRNAQQWYMRAIGKNGRIITNKKAALLISNIIKKENRHFAFSRRRGCRNSIKENYRK